MSIETEIKTLIEAIQNLTATLQSQTGSAPVAATRAAKPKVTPADIPQFAKPPAPVNETSPIKNGSETPIQKARATYQEAVDAVNKVAEAKGVPAVRATLQDIKPGARKLSDVDDGSPDVWERVIARLGAPA